MAVVVKYVVVRNGEEKMTFATKKEADAHDKMLDIADNIYEFLEECFDALNIDDAQRESLSLYLAQHSDKVVNILKGMPLNKIPSPNDTNEISDRVKDKENPDTALVEKKRTNKLKPVKENNEG